MIKKSPAWFDLLPELFELEISHVLKRENIN